MFEFNPSDYRNFLYGIVSKYHLEKKKRHAFTLWGEELILFWNNGDPRCYMNYCPHYGLPLDQGRIEGDEIVCGFHAWRFRMSDGVLIKAPLARSQPHCKLGEYEVFLKGGIVFVYPGDPEKLENAKRYIHADVIDHQSSTWINYEVPFYLAMNSSMDYPHHDSHRLFYKFYGIYRAVSSRSNPLRTQYTPVIIEETDTFFKYRITENEVEVTVYPFCTEYNDVVSKNRWQIFVSPINEICSRYMINLIPQSKNPLHRIVSKLCFYTVIKSVAMPEDSKWLKLSMKNWSKDKGLKLCDHDFGFRKYMKKFFIHSYAHQRTTKEGSSKEASYKTRHIS